MSKAILVPYTVQDYLHLNEVNVPENTALAVYDSPKWVLKTATEYVTMPANADYNKNTIVNSINVSGDTSLNLTTNNKFIELNLQDNTKLSFTNLLPGAIYIFKIVFNGYTITNINSVFKWVDDYSYDALDTLYLKVLTMHSNLYVLKYKSIPAALNRYVAPSAYVFEEDYLTSYTGTSQGVVSIVEDMLDVSAGRLIYSNNGLNLQTNFQYDIYIKHITNNIGSIASIWKDSSKQLWFYVENNKIHCLFVEPSVTINLQGNLVEGYNHITVTKLDTLYSLYINGALISYYNSTANLNISNANFVVGYLQDTYNEGVIASTSYDGYIAAIYVTDTPSVNQPYYDTFKDSYSDNVSLFYDFAYDSDDVSVNNELKTLVSDTTTYSLLDTNRLNKYHHFEVSGANQIITTEDFCVEAKINNVTGNTRGTLIRFGANYDLGIYDNKLRFRCNNSTYDVTSTDSVIIDDTDQHIAVTYTNNTIRFYIDGINVDTFNHTPSMNFEGNVAPFAIKRLNTQATTIASVNTTLYPSKSQLYIYWLKITIGDSRYTNNSHTIFPI